MTANGFKTSQQIPLILSSTTYHHIQQVIAGKINVQIEVTRRRGRKRKKLLDDIKGRTGYCQLKEEALDRTMWRNRFGRGFVPVF